MITDSVLLVPACEKGRGGGHLFRSLAIFSSLRSQKRNAYIYIPKSTAENLSLKDFGESFDTSRIISEEEKLSDFRWSLIILDRFKTPPEEFAVWSSLAPIIGIDEGGVCRDNFDFLIDLLPVPTSLLDGDIFSVNIFAPSYIPLPKNRRSDFHVDITKKVKILVSFGAEDPENMTIPACIALSSVKNAEITALIGALNRNAEREKLNGINNIRTETHIPELREHLAEYDLVLTHFGLTAFECVHARVPVVLASPGELHERTALNAGFVSAGIGSDGISKLEKLLCTKKEDGIVLSAVFFQTLLEKLKDISKRYNLDTVPTQSLGELLGSYTPHFPKSCPLCKDSAYNHTVLARFSERTYRRCTSCGMIYMLRPCPPPIEYADEYFFDFYKKQYGKTYIEDFPNLIKNSKARLKHIKSLLNNSAEKSLLDIGCAYGPFLLAAKEEGFSPTGIEPSENAVTYINEKLNLKAFKGFFPNETLPDILKDESFQVISLWYVTEHFENPSDVLIEIHRLLKKGGVLAFSTPSASGVSGRSSLKSFLEKSPADHFTVWTPRYTKAVLKRYGFTLKKIVISGHHPERFPLFGKLLNRNRGILYCLCIRLSRLLRLGDTFEVYAVKS